MNTGVLLNHVIYFILICKHLLRFSCSLPKIHVVLPANGSLVRGKVHFTSHQTHLLSLGRVWPELLLIRGSGREKGWVEEAMKPAPEK